MTWIQSLCMFIGATVLIFVATVIFLLVSAFLYFMFKTIVSEIKNNTEKTKWNILLQQFRYPLRRN